MRSFTNRDGHGSLIEQLTELPTPSGQAGNAAATSSITAVRSTWRSTAAGRVAPYTIAMLAPPVVAEDAYTVSVRSTHGAVPCQVVWLRQGDFLLRLDIGGELQSRGAAQHYSELAIASLKRALA